MREQRIGLEHQVHRPPVRRHADDVPAVEQDAAAVRRLEAGQHAQQRGLAAAGGPEQGEELVLADVERDAVDRREPAEALGDPVDRRAGSGRALMARPVPRLSRCESVSAMTLTAMTMVASALISGVMPKRIIE